MYLYTKKSIITKYLCLIITSFAMMPCPNKKVRRRIVIFRAKIEQNREKSKQFPYFFIHHFTGAGKMMDFLSRIQY